MKPLPVALVPKQKLQAVCFTTVQFNFAYQFNYKSIREMSFLKDFKEFAMKGNIIDMAVGVIIGGAFGAIVSSLVNDIIMPVVSLVTGGDGLKNLKYVIVHAKDAADGVAAVEEVAINYGVFIQNIVDFLIIAFSIFVALRVIMKFKKKEKEEEAAAPAPEPSKEEVLLTEIRDLLKQQAEKK